MIILRFKNYSNQKDKNRDKAFENLTKTFDENWAALGPVFLTHFFDKYRADREFVDLLKKTGFEFRQFP